MILAVALLLAAAAPEPATCLITGRQLDYKFVSETELLIRAGGRWHRSALPEACPGLKPNMILVRREASPRLCANDLFEVKDNFTPQVFSLCRFGRFELLDKASRF